MTRRHTLGWLGAGLLAACGTVTASEPTQAPKSIPSLIRELGDSSYERRSEAARQLCTIGLSARAALREAAENGDPEVALRAKQLLTTLERLLFSQVEVRLSFSRDTVAWNESIDLIVEMVNRGAHPAKVPFETDQAVRASRAAEAAQVGDLLDVSEWLTVQSESGRDVSVRVDDVLTEGSVMREVERRLSGEPVGLLAPGERCQIEVRDFNRGWARYPLLDAGRYLVKLEYLPEWEDEQLLARGVGRVASNVAEVLVKAGAPPTVSRGSREASLVLERDRGDVIARIVNHSDLAVQVNTNLGRGLPFAQAQWVHTLGTTVHEAPVLPGGTPTWDDFAAARLVSVEPGGATELLRTSLGEIREQLRRVGADVDHADGSIHLTYVSLCGRQWQRDQGPALLGNSAAPPLFRALLPRRLLAARLASDPL